MSWLVIWVMAMLAVINVAALWKLWGIFKAFDDVILKTLTDTNMIEKHKLLVDTLTKFGENDRKRKDKEFSDLRATLKALELELRSAKTLIDSLRKDR